MAKKDIIILKQKELKRLSVIHKVIERRIKQKPAGDLLKLSTRQIRRLLKRVKDQGDKGIAHLSRGKPSHNAKSVALKEKVKELYRKKYWDFGPTLASEKLFEIDKIKLSDETLRSWLIESGDWKNKRKSRQYRHWRERKPCLGEMIQADGSHHDWFEGRAPECVLMGYIDDATNRVYARFYEYEGTKPAMDSFKRYITKYGIPQSLYMDNHSTYKSPKKQTLADELANKLPLSQFERAAEELGVHFIHAQSAPAKGRIERLFGTFQDRVIKEMRLQGVSSIKAGNKFLERYLPKYNKRFSIPAASTVDLHQPLLKNRDIDSKLCIKEERTLRNDFTVAYNNKFYQVLNRTAAKKVTIEERLSGEIKISYQNKQLKYKLIQARQVRPKEKQLTLISNKRAHTPALEHPWKKPSYDAMFSQKEKELQLVH